MKRTASKKKNPRRTITISVMAPVTVEMVVERYGDEDSWTPVEIIRSDYRHTMTPTFVNENSDEFLRDEIDEKANSAGEVEKS